MINVSEDIARTMSEIENELSDLSLEERFDKLIQDLMAFQYVIIERHRRTGEPIEPHQAIWITDSMVHLKNIEKLMAYAKKYHRLSTKPNEKFDQQTTQRIREMKSSISDIVRKIPIVKKDESSNS